MQNEKQMTMSDEKTPKCKGTIIPTMRSLPLGETTPFPLERLGALRTGSWFLSKKEGLYFTVKKGAYKVFVTRNL